MIYALYSLTNYDIAIVEGKERMSFWRIAKSTGNPRSRDEKNVVECYSESVKILEGEGYSKIQ